MRIVIIGNGVAGIEAALLVRREDERAEITLISEESDHFFSRTALMYVLAGQMRYRDIEPYERDLYERMRWARVRARAVRVDPALHEVHLAGAEAPLRYDRLLIACGSKPRRPPWRGADLLGVGHFVTLQDLEWLEDELHGGPGADRPPRPDAVHGSPVPGAPLGSPYARRKVRHAPRGRGPRPRRAAVIGGGLIGSEVVETFLSAHVHTDFFLREEWFYPLALDARESAWIAERLREHGVEVHLGADVEALEGDASGAIEAVRARSGERTPCDLAVVAIGVVPNTDWLSGSAIERDSSGGIVVDEALNTSARDVFAAGDCASVRWADGSRRPEQLWYTARDQGRVAAAGLVGRRSRYERGVWYNSAKLMDVEYTTVGWVNQKLDGESSWFHEERSPVRSTTRIVMKDDAVVGFNLLGRRWDHQVLMRWIREKRGLDFVLDNLEDASFDTELVPPLELPGRPVGR